MHIVVFGHYECGRPSPMSITRCSWTPPNQSSNNSVEIHVVTGIGERVEVSLLPEFSYKFCASMN